MSFLYFRPYLSVVAGNNRCPISIYSRFLIALFVLGVGLTASVAIKKLPQKEVVSTSNIDETGAPLKGSLESFPRDFTLNSSELFGSYRIPSRIDESSSEKQRHVVSKKPADQAELMGKTYPGNMYMSDGDDAKPSLPLNYGGVSEEELLKLGYRRHITVNGDCLNKLAEKYLHDADRWREIYNLNSNQLSNKDVVPIGIVLIIPAK